MTKTAENIARMGRAKIVNRYTIQDVEECSFEPLRISALHRSGENPHTRLGRIVPIRRCEAIACTICCETQTLFKEPHRIVVEHPSIDDSSGVGPRIHDCTIGSVTDFDRLDWQLQKLISQRVCPDKYRCQLSPCADHLTRFRSSKGYGSSLASSARCPASV